MSGRGAILALAVLGGCAAPSDERRAEAFVAPAGCEHLATVQQRSCTTVQVLSCVAGTLDRRLVEHVDGTPREQTDLAYGLFETRIERIRAVAMVEPAPTGITIPETLDPRPAPIERDAQMIGRDGRVGGSISERVEWVGQTTITERDVFEVDRQTTLTMGGSSGTVSGRAYYDPQLGALIGHRFEHSGRVTDKTPVAVILPGEPGFAATTPVTPCAAS